MAKMSTLLLLRLCLLALAATASFPDTKPANNNHRRDNNTGREEREDAISTVEIFLVVLGCVVGVAVPTVAVCLLCCMYLWKAQRSTQNRSRRDGLSYEANSDSPEHQLESLCVEPFTPVEAQTSHCVSEPYANPAHTYDVPARIPPIARPLVESATIGEKALPLTTAYDTPFDSYVVPVQPAKLSTLSGAVQCIHNYHKLYLPQLSDSEDNESCYRAPATDEEHLYDQLNYFKVKIIQNHQLKITCHLGRGHFGHVSRATWSDEGGEREVAVKVLGRSERRVEFLQEAAVMCQFAHPNVIQLHGITTGADQLMLVVELASNGDLCKYLKSMRARHEGLPTDAPRMLLSFTQQVALGMHYLSSKGFVHRDLAARNILVFEDHTCKIGDFGLSRDLADRDYYQSRGGDIPIKWSAPEAIHHKKYSTASDVWSYGCLLYEIWSLGEPPFKGCTNSEAIGHIDAGFRLPPPPGCPRKIYKLMIKTWHPKAHKRPNFKEIVIELLGREDKLLKIPWEDRVSDRQAAWLGAPLRASRDLYPELQSKYTTIVKTWHM